MSTPNSQRHHEVLIHDGLVKVRGAREHNLKNIDVDIPRDRLVVFTGVSGSGKSSLAFATLYGEAQRRYLESVAPYARRLFDQVGSPDVDDILGLPPAIALQQQRGSPTSRSSVGSMTTIANLLRMLYSRVGDYPKGAEMLHAELFSPNTPEGACADCHGMGRHYDATEASMVLDASLTIRERAIAAWPTAWQGQNLRDILVTLGYDVDRPWREIPKKDRQWILFTEEQPTVPVYAGYTPAETKRALKRKEEPSYQGTFMSARRYLLHALATTESPLMKKRVLRYLVSAECRSCGGKRLRREALQVKFAGFDIAEIGHLPLSQLATIFAPYAEGHAAKLAELASTHPEKAEVAQRISHDLCLRLAAMLKLGLGYLSLDRSTQSLSPGELQRLRLATQVRSNLFGVVYVLDEPSAGLHPADTEALLDTLFDLKAAGNSVFVVEHEIDVIRRAEWIVDVGPEAGERGGHILYSGPLAGLQQVEGSKTRSYLTATHASHGGPKRVVKEWLSLHHVTHNNLHDLAVRFPLSVLTSVTGVSGSGKSSLVSQVLVSLLRKALGHDGSERQEVKELDTDDALVWEGSIASGAAAIKRLVQVDQKPIGRTPRSNLATYTGLFDDVRKLFAATKLARARRYDAGRFSFNVAKGRCEHCEGEGYVSVELLFMASVYTPCPVCHGARYNAKTLEVTYRGKTIADVLSLTVDAAVPLFADEKHISRALAVLCEVGVGYLRLGQPATELSGGEAQRIKLATELQRAERGATLYVLDEPTTGLHPSDVEKLMTQLHRLVDAGNTVIVVEHDMQVIANSDWIIDMGPGAGELGGSVVATGRPEDVAKAPNSRTAPYLANYLVDVCKLTK